MLSTDQPGRRSSRRGLIPMFASGLIALVAGLISSPFDEPALVALMIAVYGFMLFSIYVIALVPVIVVPRRCPACHHRSLFIRLFDLTRPFGGLRQCRRCGVVCFREWSGPWIVISAVESDAKPEMPDHPLWDEIV